MATVRDVITEALVMLGVHADGEPLDAVQAAGGLRALNTLIESWQTERLLVYVIDRQTFSLVAGTQTYTLGPGGAWDTTPLYGAGAARPVRIEEANWRDPSTLLELPVHIMSEGEYHRLRVRNTTGGIVTHLYYSQAFPLGSVFVWPVPSTTDQMVLWLWHPWVSTNTLDTVVSFPPGYQAMLEYNLAVWLSARYPGTLRPELVTLAADLKGKVKRLNHKSPHMISDAAGVLQGGVQGGGYTAWSHFLSDQG